MPDELNSSRGRLHLGDAKVEALLGGVERGSYRHIIELSTAEWPKSPKDSAIVLRTILTILEDEPTPPRPQVQSGVQLLDAVEGTLPLRRVTGLVRLFMRAIIEPGVAERSASKSSFSDIFEDHLNVAIRWFEFYIQAGSWTYALNPHESGDAPVYIAEHFYALYLSASDKLKAGMHTSERAVELVLALFVSHNEKGVCHGHGGIRLTPDCPFVYLMSGFCRNSVSKTKIASILACFTQAKRRQFLDSATSRIRLWAERQLRKTDPSTPEHIRHIVALTNELLDVAGPQYCKAYFASKFPSTAIKISNQFHGFLTSRGIPLSIDIMAIFLTTVQHGSTQVQHALLLELLDNGLMKSLVNDLLSQRHESPSVWSHWCPSGRSDTRTPLEVLVMVGIHQDVCEAISAAINSINEDDIKRLGSTWAEKYWKPFAETIELYAMAWKHEVPEDGIAMCDNTVHDHGETVEQGQTKECSRCRTTAYCSQRCQKLDWDMGHKEECRFGRIVRMEREMNHSWVSHRLRSFLFLLTQHFVLNFEIGLPLQWRQLHCTVPGQWGSPLAFPVPSRHPQAATRSNLLRTTVLYFQTTKCPPEFLPRSVDQMLKLKHDGRPLFHESRFVDIFEEHRCVSSNQGDLMLPGEWIGHPLNASVSKVWRVAVCSAIIGEYAVFFVGRFIVERAADMTRVRRLNGYVKVCERAKLD